MRATLVFVIVTSVAAGVAGCRQVQGIEERTSGPSTGGSGGAAGMAAAGAAGTAGAAGQAACTHECCKNMDCVMAHDAPYVCRKNACVALKTPECTDVVGDGYKSDDGVLIGFMDTMTGAAYQAKAGTNHLAAVKLAASEFAANTVGTFPGADGSPVPLTLIACDEQGSASAVSSAHLIDELGVKAILGPTFDTAFVAVLNQYANPGKALLLSSSVSNPNFPALNQAGLGWSCTPNNFAADPALEQEAREAERLVRKRRGLAATDPVRLVMVAAGDPASQAGNTTLVQQLLLNGKVAIDQESPDPTHPELGSFYYFSYPDPLVESVDYDAVVAKILAFKPDIIMPFGGPDISAQIMPKTEAAYAGAATKDKPIWTMYFVEDPGFVDLACGPGAATDPAAPGYGKCVPPGLDDYRKRIMGFAFRSENADIRQSFASNFKAANDGKTPLPFAAAAYDSYYVLVYALTAAAAANPTIVAKDLSPQQIAAGIAKLLPQPGAGTSVVGGDQIPAAFVVLRGGGAVDLEGASGHLAFDTTPTVYWPHGLCSPRTTIDLWCIATDSTFITNGQTYDAASGTFSPAMFDIGECP